MVVDPLGQPLGDGGLTHARLADEAGVVLLPAVEDLDGALDLVVPAHNVVQLALGGFPGERDTVVLQKLPFGWGLALFLLGGVGAGAVVRRGGGTLPAKELVEEGESSGAAVVVLIAAVLWDSQAVRLLRAAEGGEHLIGDILQVLLGNAHLLHHIVHGLNAQIPGAFQAQAFVPGLAPFYFCDKHHGHILVAAAAQRRLHKDSPFRDQIYFGELYQNFMNMS